jgi:hypothetical protein
MQRPMQRPLLHTPTPLLEPLPSYNAFDPVQVEICFTASASLCECTKFSDEALRVIQRDNPELLVVGGI